MGLGPDTRDRDVGVYTGIGEDSIFGNITKLEYT